MAVRKKLNHDTRTREKIQTTQLVNRLAKHAVGEVEMTSTQIRAAEILLNKTLPNLQAIDVKAEVTNTDARTATDNELLDIATGGSAGTAEPESIETKPH